MCDIEEQKVVMALENVASFLSVEIWTTLAVTELIKGRELLHMFSFESTSHATTASW